MGASVKVSVSVGLGVGFVVGPLKTRGAGAVAKGGGESGFSSWARAGRVPNEKMSADNAAMAQKCEWLRRANGFDMLIPLKMPQRLVVDTTAVMSQNPVGVARFQNISTAIDNAGDTVAPKIPNNK